MCLKVSAGKWMLSTLTFERVYKMICNRWLSWVL